MTTTIAIIGHNGNVGKKVLPHLVKAHLAGQIRLVVLHRATSSVESIPSEVERRVLSDTDASLLKEVVKGINVLLLVHFSLHVALVLMRRSTIGHEGFALQESLVEALAGSPDIQTFIPASFGAVWTDEILQKPTVRAFHEPYDRLSAKVKELGIGFTQIRAGLFLQFTFMAG
jgi:nucleoside-diphosphate-sugar epimerase